MPRPDRENGAQERIPEGNEWREGERRSWGVEWGVGAKEIREAGRTFLWDLRFDIWGVVSRYGSCATEVEYYTVQSQVDNRTKSGHWMTGAGQIDKPQVSSVLGTSDLVYRPATCRYLQMNMRE